MSNDNWLLILWLGVSIYLIARLKWFGFTIGMLVFWVFVTLFIEADWLSCEPEFEPLRHPLIFITGFILFSGFWFVFYGIKWTFFAKMPVSRWYRRLAIGAVSVLALSFTLGLADFCLARFDRNPIFSSVEIGYYLDGETTDHGGFGYVLSRGSNLEGEVGPEIWYWFLPFKICDTTKTTGVRWLWSREISSSADSE